MHEERRKDGRKEEGSFTPAPAAPAPGASPTPLRPSFFPSFPNIHRPVDELVQSHALMAAAMAAAPSRGSFWQAELVKAIGRTDERVEMPKWKVCTLSLSLSLNANAADAAF